MKDYIIMRRSILTEYIDAFGSIKRQAKLLLAAVIFLPFILLWHYMSAQSEDLLNRFVQVCLSQAELKDGFVDWKEEDKTDQTTNVQRNTEALESEAQKGLTLLIADTKEGRQFRWNYALTHTIEEKCDSVLHQRTQEQLDKDARIIASRYILLEPR